MSSAATHKIVLVSDSGPLAVSDGARRNSIGLPLGNLEERAEGAERIRLCVAAQNRLLREALARMLRKTESIELIGFSGYPHQDENGRVPGKEIDVLLLISCGSLQEDIETIRQAHSTDQEMRILLVGPSRRGGEFLQCVRAGVSGFLCGDASSADILEAIRAVQRGEAVCPGELCSVLFRYFERESSTMPSADVRQQLGFTRREQQLIPLLAKGLTNKEIANRLCLSEQTVKNHLYRMKRKIGAEDRLSIVKRYRTEGFLL